VEYKVRQEEKRLASLTKQAEKKQAQIEKLDANLSVKTNAKATLDEVNAMGKPALLGGVNFTDTEAKKLKSLAKKGVGIDKRADGYRKKIAALDGQIHDLTGQIDDWKRSYQTAAQERNTYKHNYERLWAEVKPFIDAIRKAPQMLLDFIREHLQQHNLNKREVR
jgi:DNA repair exonuclease SbcCD ATPase subunit